MPILPQPLTAALHGCFFRSDIGSIGLVSNGDYRETNDNNIYIYTQKETTLCFLWSCFLYDGHQLSVITDDDDDDDGSRRWLQWWRWLGGRGCARQPVRPSRGVKSTRNQLDNTRQHRVSSHQPATQHTNGPELPSCTAAGCSPVNKREKHTAALE